MVGCVGALGGGGSFYGRSQCQWFYLCMGICVRVEKMLKMFKHFSMVSIIRARYTQMYRISVCFRNGIHFDYDWGARMVSQRYIYTHMYGKKNWSRKGANTARWCQFSWRKSLKIEWKLLLYNIHTSSHSSSTLYLPICLSICRQNIVIMVYYLSQYTNTYYVSTKPFIARMSKR